MEVWGASILGCLQGLERAGLPIDYARALLAGGGLVELEPEGWYPQQPYLDLFRALEAQFGEGALRVMAAQVPDTSRFPPGIQTLEQAMQSLDIAYQLNHRGGAIGRYACLPLGHRALELTCDTPYGCAFDLGILDALVTDFAPPGSRPVVTHAPGTPCRRLGGEACTYLVNW